MSKYKRMLALIMALATVCSLLPFHVFATEANVPGESRTDEQNITTLADPINKTVLNGDIKFTFSAPVEYEPNDAKQEYVFWGPIGQACSFTVMNSSASNLAWNAKFNNSWDVANITVDGEPVSANGITLYPGNSVTIGFTTIAEYGGLQLDQFTSEVASSGKVQLNYDSNLGYVTVNGTKVDSGAMVDIGSAGASIEAVPNSGVSFLGWVNPADHTYKSGSNISGFTVSNGQNVVEAAFGAVNGKAWFYAGKNNNNLYDDLNAAATYAASQNNKLLTLAANGTLVSASNTYNIPSGVKLLIPRAADDMTGNFDAEPNGTETKYGSSQRAFRTLTVPNGTVLNFNGTSQLNVNGSVYEKSGSYTGVCTDTYGCIELGTGAKINMNSGSTLYCYGYIIGDGEVIANDGSNVYEVFQMTGWRGGTITNAWKDASGIKNFAFNDYAVQNIEANFVVNYGATANVTATVAVSTISKTVDAVYIGKYGSGLIQLESGASVHRSFDPATSRVKYTFYGNTHVAGIDLTVTVGSFIFQETISLNTAKKILSIPYYWDFVAATDSKVTLHNDYKILPGATLTAMEKAEVNVKGNLYLYDTDDYVGKGYTNSGNSVPVRYVASTGATAGSLPKMNSGTLSAQVTVNGTLRIDGAVYVTENGGTSVEKVLKGTGVVINNSEADKAVANVLDEFVYDSANKKIVDHNINVIPVVGRIAGVSVGEKYHCFAKGTYYGVGDGFWYQHVVSTNSFECIKDFKSIPAAATAAVDRQRTVTNLGAKIENVLGFVSDYMDISGETAEIITTPFTFTVNSLIGVTCDENSALTGRGITTDPYVLTVNSGNTVLTSGKAVAGENEILMRYDDHQDMTGKDVEIIDAGMPESYQVGYGVEENTVKDTAVVAMEGKYLVATGIGTATVSVDGVVKTVKVCAAPISMLFLGGQSNMQGSRGEGKESIVIPAGQSYLTYGERYSMDTSNAAKYAPSALAGEYRTVNVKGTEDCLSMFPVNSFEEKVATHDTYGKDGPDSGFALQWIQSTGEKVWVINAAHGGSSISEWQDGAAEYEQAVQLFKACMETMQKEIAAGHYTLSHMGFYWCQGCTDSGKSAEWYAPKFVAMYDAMKADLSMDMDSNPATPNQTLEFANIVLTVAGHMTTTGYRYEEGLYVAGDGNGFTTVEDLEMRGQRVAQLWLGANPEYPDINVVSNLVDSWITMPDGSDGVAEYFQKYYPNGRVDYVTQTTKSDSWRTPTDANDVRASASPIHYNQLGYNEMGREAVRNTMYLLGYVQDPAGVETEVTFYDWTGYREVTQINAETVAQSSTLVVPVVSPIYRSKEVRYVLSEGLAYKYYDLTAETTMTNGTLKAVGADGNSVNVRGRELSEFRWDLVGTNLVSTGAVENKATKVQGSIGADGVYTDITYSLDEAIVLKPDQNWLVEWKMTGPAADVTGYKKIMAQYATRAEGDVSLMVHGNGQVVFGHYVGSHSQYGVLGQDLSGTHVYRLVNRVDAAGINMPYLYIDGVEIGPMNKIPGSEEGDDTDNWAEGREIVLNSIGQTNYPISKLSIEYIYVKEAGASFDMHIHTWGEWEVTTAPTENAVGEETRTCSVCNETETREVAAVSYNSFRWELQGTKLVSVGEDDNVLTKIGSGTINAETGIFTNIRYGMTTPVKLERTENWSVEIKMVNTWKQGVTKILCDNSGPRNPGDIAISAATTGIYFSYVQDNSNKSHTNKGKTGLMTSGDTNPHIFTIFNVYDAELDTNKVYISFDGGEAVAMDSAVNNQSYEFAYIGNSEYPLTQGSIQYIAVNERVVIEEDNGITGTGKYRWELKGDTLVSKGEERNTVTRDQGTTEDDLFLQTRFSIEKPIELKHNQPWTLEWEMTGDWNATNSKLKKLFSEDGLKATTGAEAIMISPDGWLSIGYYDGTHKYVGIRLPETIELNEINKFKLENRNEANGSNMVYLWANGVEIGAMNTPLTDGISENWVADNDFTFGYFGVNEEYFLDGGLINYIVVDEARDKAFEEIPEEPNPEVPAEPRIKYRWELNEAGTELVSVVPFGYTENVLKDKFGSITGGVTKNLQYAFTTPVVLNPADPWTVEWKMSGSKTSNWQKVLATQVESGVVGDFCIMLKGETLSLGKYYQPAGGEKTHYNYNDPAAVADTVITFVDEHTYKLENRIDESGNNTVYLWIDGTDYGAMVSGKENVTWLSGAEITFNYIGQKNSYPLNGAAIKYIDIDLANAPEAVPEEPEAPDVTGTWYRWELNQTRDELVSYTDKGYTENALTNKVGTITDGKTSNLQYKFTNAVVLDHNKPWTIEWEMTRGTRTAWQKILAGQANAQGGTENCLMVQNTNTISLSKYTSTNSHNNYYVDGIAASGIDFADLHKYKLENRINEDETNTIYLLVDDTQIGAFDVHGDSSKPAWIVGADLTFNYIGQQMKTNGTTFYGLDGATINYIEIYLGDAPAEAPEETPEAPEDVFVKEIYRWDMINNVLVSGGEVANALTMKTGSITNGVLSDARFAIEKPIVLNHDQDWILEFQMKYNGTSEAFQKLLAENSSRQTNDKSIAFNIHQFAAVVYTSSGHVQYGANEFTANGINMNEQHKFRLQNTVNSDGTNMVYLYVDDQLVGPMDRDLKNSKNSDWIVGQDFVFTSLGQTSYLVKNLELNCIRVQESSNGHVHKYNAAVTNPTCTTAGFTTYTCIACADSYTDDETEISGHTKGEAVVENMVDSDYNTPGHYDSVIYCTVCKEELSRETITIAVKGAEAKIGDINYATLAEAVAAASENDTIVVLADIEVEDTVDAGSKTIDFNGHSVKGNVFGKLMLNGGTLITAEGYKMAGPDGDYYKTTDNVVLTLDADKNLTVHSGTIEQVRDEWWTLANQTLVIEEGATFVVPAGKTLQILSNVTLDGTATIDGTVNLYSADATITTENANLTNITTTAGDSVLYVNGKYVVHNHNFTGDWDITAAGHAHKCKACGEVDPNVAEHADATVKDHMCDVCGFKMSTCESSEKTATCVHVDGTETHTVTVTCKVCGEQIGEVTTEACADGDDADTNCDKCGASFGKKVTFNNVTSTTSGAQIMIGGQEIGSGEAVLGADGVFTVTHDKACVVIVAIDNGDGTKTYHKLTAHETAAADTYSFSINDVPSTVDTTAGAMEIIVAVKGDLNENGEFDSTDVNRARLAYAGKVVLNDKLQLVMDLNNNNEFDSTDVNRARLAYAGKVTIAW